MQSFHDNSVATDQKESISPLSRHISLFTEIEKNLDTKNETTLATKNTPSTTNSSSSSTSSQHLYYLKKHSGNRNTYIAAIEAYSANICRYLATSEYIPATYLYHDDNHTIGIVSKKKPDFKSNCDDPLTENDIIINSSLLKKEQQQRILMQQLITLLEFYQKETDASCKTILNLYHSFFAASSSNRGMRDYLAKFKNSSIYFTKDQLDSLLSTILRRIDQLKSHIVSGDTAKTFKREKMHLKEMTKSITTIQKLDLANDSSISVTALEEFDKLTKKRKVNLNDDHTILEEIIFGSAVRITAADLKNYRKLKGIATTQTTRFIFKDYDNNNQNLSKNGEIIDFDWAKSTISADMHTEPNWADILYHLNIDPFVADANNIQYLPDINPDFLLYWPTKQTDAHLIIINVINRLFTLMRSTNDSKYHDTLKTIANYILLFRVKLDDIKNYSQSSYDQFASYASQLILALEAFNTGQSMYDLAINKEMNALIAFSQSIFMNFTEKHMNEIINLEKICQQKFGNKKNAFTLQDNVIYKSLATHPVVVFHKYKTFLKYILTNENLYENLAKLCIPSSPQTEMNLFTNYQKDSLREKLVNDEIIRMNEIHHTLLTMQDFKDFMQHHGEYAFSMIQEETASYQKKYSRKLEEKPYYGSLVNTIIKNPLEEKFTCLCDSLDIARPLINRTNTLS